MYELGLTPLSPASKFWLKIMAISIRTKISFRYRSGPRVHFSTYINPQKKGDCG